ncbi:MAG TPA: Na+/H+ antiporter NhaA [Labilithrix sp.]|nr:Na+/H+ antiporter NhaA [Labilithrix sp.]
MKPAVEAVLTSVPPSDPPPGASPFAHRLARRLVTPIEAFLHVQAASGLVLVVTALLAMVLANSPWATAFHDLLETPLGIRLGSLTVEHSVHFWVNDGLMTIFFFVVGLEIRREAHEGELSTARRAALPVAAALGGMVVPALLYIAVAGHHAADRPGWGVPMATDIAFAVGVLALLGRRVPPALRVLLLALAIIDDIGSIVVIATFYSASLDTSGFLVAGGGIAAILLLQRFGIRRPLLYVLPGVIVWAGVLRSGVHPTIAGVIVGLLTPARSWLGPTDLVEAARRSAQDMEHELATGEIGRVRPERLAEEVSRIDLASRESLAPATRLQLALHPWVAFVIMPLFAFANAGVTIDGGAATVSSVGAGIALGLVVGKPIGVIGACIAASRTGIALLPRGIGLRELSVLGLVAGIGFTMALFVAGLAFPSGQKLSQAKLAILVASASAMALGLVVGRALLRPSPVADAATTESEAERSDDA